MRKLFYILLFLILGCNEDTLNIKNPNSYTEDTYFTNVDQCKQAVNAIYAGFYFRGLYAREYYFIFDLLGNEAEAAIPLEGPLTEFAKYTFGPSNENLDHLWRSYYRIILRSNLVFDKVGKWLPTMDTDKEIRNRFLGEASFLRAYAYFDLVTLFGRVPIKDSWDDRKEFAAPRADSVQQVWSLIEKDLSQAIAQLPQKYEKEEKGRATSGAARALLGKSYLFRKKWKEASEMFSTIETAPYEYSLTSNFSNNFLSTNENNEESVFEIQLEFIPGSWFFYMFGGQELWGGVAAHNGRAMEYGWNDWQNVYISDAAVNAFTYKDESDITYVDPRASMTFYGPPSSGGDLNYCNYCQNGPKPYPYTTSGNRWKKYNEYEFKEKEENPQSSINARVFRYADVLLMHAEALIELNDISTAQKLINVVRRRAGAFEYTTLGTKEDALRILRRERQLELCGEQHRYFDLIRWGIARATINSEKTASGYPIPPFRAKDILLPIPQTEKDLNPNVANDVKNDWN